MKNQNIFFASILGLQIFISIILFFSEKDSFDTSVDKDYFKISDTEKIDKVIMTTSKNSIELSFLNNQWLVNKNYLADYRLIEVLFATMQQISTRRPVSIAKQDSVVEILNKTGTKVVFLEGDKTKLEFLAGGNSDKTESWFLKTEEKQPYIMTIHGYHVYVSGIFELDINGWRNKRIFDFDWRGFKSLSTVIKSDSSLNFDVEMKKGKINIVQIKNVDLEKVNTYLDDLSLLFASRFVNYNTSSIDSLVKNRPISVIIKIKDRSDGVYYLEILESIEQDKEIYAVFNQTQTMAIDKSEARKVLKGRNYFVKNEGAKN